MSTVWATAAHSRNRWSSWGFQLETVLILIGGMWGLTHSGTVTGFHLGGFGFSLTLLRSWFLIILGLVASAAAWFQWGYLAHMPIASRSWVLGWMPGFVLSMAAVIVANSVWAFAVAWEMMAMCSLALVITQRTRKVLRAGYVYAVMSQLSGLAILGGLLLMAGATHSIWFENWAGTTVASSTRLVILGCWLLGFGLKAGVVPLHVWLPKAHPVAPASVSGLMSGAMIKLGIFGLLQFVLVYLAPVPPITVPILLGLGAGSSLLGVLYALAEHDLKRLLAYHSIENIGIILLGLGVLAWGEVSHQPLWIVLGLTAALFHTLNHALFKSQLFFSAGAIEHHTGSLDLDRLGGIVHTAPALFWGFLTGAMAISALPPFNGFLSEWLTLRGLLALMHQPVETLVLGALGLAAVLALTGALAGLCFVKATGITFLGQPRAAYHPHPVPFSMLAPILLLGGLSLGLGIFPGEVLATVDRILPTVSPGLSTGLATGFQVLQPVHPTTVGLGLLALAGLMVLWVRGYRLATRPRWGCGMTVNPGMQYTAGAFASSVETAFAVLYRPVHHVARTGSLSTYFPEDIIYHGRTVPLWERYVYAPLVKGTWSVSRWLARRHTGSTRLYLLYILATVTLLLSVIRS